MNRKADIFIAMLISAIATKWAVAGETFSSRGHGLPDVVTVWSAGTDGYHTYRIPAILITDRGTLLAFCEGRKHSHSDAGKVDILVRRSVDGGRTWSPQKVIWSDGNNTCGNPCPVVDRETGHIWLLMSHNLGGEKWRKIAARKTKGTRTVWVTHSEDDGVTWASPANITADVKRPDWTWYATGPGVGIQLEQGKHRGRLLIPCDFTTENKGKYYSHVIYSDDHGKTWQLGGTIPSAATNECQLVELTDGQLMINCRNHSDSDDKTPRPWRRQVSLSDDGGITWSPVRSDEALPEPMCQASIIRCYSPAETEKPWLLFSNPADESERRNLTIRLSKDDGKTWAHSKVLYPGPAAYSCLAMLPNGRAACLYECDASEKIQLALFSLDWLMSR